MEYLIRVLLFSPTFFFYTIVLSSLHLTNNPQVGIGSHESSGNVTINVGLGTAKIDSTSSSSSSKEKLQEIPDTLPKESDVGPLHWAAFKGDLPEVVKLLNAGSNINELSPGESGMYPIMFAARGGHVETMKFLVSMGCGLADERDDQKLPLIHLAVDSDSLECVEYCLSLGNSVDTRSKTGELPLHRAIWRKHQTIIDYLLSKGANKNERVVSTLDTPFILAAKTGQLTVMKKLKELDADLSLTNARGCSALHCAAEGGDLQVLNSCLEWGLEVKNCDIDGKTLLHYAVSSGKVEVVERVLALSPEIDKADNFGTTAISLAVSRKLIPIAKRLKKINSDSRRNYSDGKTLLHIAAQSGSAELVAWCLEFIPDKMVEDYFGRVPLHYASASENIDSVKLLCDSDTVNITSRQNESHIGMAISTNNLPIVSYLVESGADLITGNSDKTSYLHEAVRCNADTVIEFLVKKGVRPAEQDYRGWTALHYAAHDTKLLKAFNALLRCYDGLSVTSSKKVPANLFDINALTTRLETPLMLAAKSGNVEAVKKLKEKNAAVALVDCDGKTALELALEADEDECATLLIPSASSETDQTQFNRWIFLAVRKDCQKCVTLLLSDGRFDQQVIDVEGKTLLHLAAISGNRNLIAQIIGGKKIPLNSQDTKKRTALICAAQNGQSRVIEDLVAAKADMSIADEQGQTALHYTMENRNFTGSTYLIARGAPVTAQNMQGRTPFHRARTFFKADQTTALFQAIPNVSQRKKVASLRDLEGSTMLESATLARDWNLISLLKIYEADVTTKKNDGNTLVHTAVMADSPSTVEYIVKLGSSPLEKNKKGIYPIHLVILADKDADIIKFLKSSKDALTPEGQTALLLAARHKNRHAVTRLVELEARDLQDQFGFTALMVSASIDETSIWSILFPLADAMSISLRSRDQKTLLHHLIEGNSIDKLEQFIKKFPAHFVRQSKAYDDRGLTPLHLALKARKSIAAVWLINHLDQADQPSTQSGETALGLAVVEGDVESAKLLKKRTTDFNAVDAMGNSLMHLAVRSQVPKMVDVCFEWGIDSNTKNNQGYTPLHAAVLRNIESIIPHLKDADMYVKTPEGETIAHLATRLGYLGIVEFCRTLNFDFDEKDSYGKSPHDYLAEHGSLLNIDAKKNNDDGNMQIAPIQDLYDKELFDSILAERMDLFERAIQRKANINRADGMGYTPLHIAASTGNLAAVKRLCELHADGSLRANDGKTAAELATFNGNKKCAAYLTSIPKM